MSKHELSLVEVTHYTDPEVLAIVKDFHVRGNFASLPEFARVGSLAAAACHGLKLPL